MKNVRWFAVVMVSFVVGCSSSADTSPIADSDAGTQPDSNTPKSDAGDPALTPVPTAQGASTGAAVTATVGEAGGELTAADGRFSLVVPPGALSAPIELSIEPITNTAHGGIGGSYRLGPEGTTFAKPATITFTAASDDLNNVGFDAIRIAFQSTDGLWHVNKNSASDAAAKRVSTETTHLSNWSPVSGIWLFPKSTSVKVKGSVEYSVESCFRYESKDDPLDVVPLGYPCSKEAALLTLQGYDWAVEGAVGGDAEHGTFASGSGGLTNTYTAPSSSPDPNVTIVSARVGPIEKNAPDMIVQAVVTIEEEDCPGKAATEYAGSCDYVPTTPYCEDYYVQPGKTLPSNVSESCEGSMGHWKSSPCGKTQWFCTGTHLDYKMVNYLKDSSFASSFQKNCLSFPCNTFSQ